MGLLVVPEALRLGQEAVGVADGHDLVVGGHDLVEHLAFGRGLLPHCLD
ncbi:hypothetical protein [Microvirga tunisiensis]